MVAGVLDVRRFSADHFAASPFVVKKLNRPTIAGALPTQPFLTITSTTVYKPLAPIQFKDFWRN
jgi:hypothetical protein